jgi:WD40 repeat protein
MNGQPETPADGETQDALLRIDELCDRFEDEWRAGRRPDLDAFASAGGSERADLVRELVRLDVEYRRRAGENPTCAEYAERFPEVEDWSAAFPGGDPAAPRPASASTITALGTAPGFPTDPDGAPPEPPQLPGYTILGELGRGGMGVVYAAEHTLMGRKVAVKVIAPHLLAHHDSADRFRHEVRAAARLAHPNIVTAYNAEQFGPLMVLVMEFVEGRSLAAYVAEHGPLPVAEACEYARQAAVGLAHAHAMGMVHRDVKPHNLMRTAEGQVKILDLGLARFAADQPAEPPADTAASGTEGLTHTGACMGTLDYMAPEQAKDARAADARSDVYALGCTLYHLLSGRVPFPGGTALEKLARLASDEPVPLTELRPDASPELAALVARLMAKRPENRVASAKEAAELLSPFAGEPERVRPRRRFTIAVASAAMVLVLVAAVVAALRSPTRDDHTADEPLPVAEAPAPAPTVPQASEVRRFAGHAGTVHSVAVSPDGQLIATASGFPLPDATVRVWDAASGRELHRLEGHAGPVQAVAFGADGWLLSAGGQNGAVRVWNPVAGQFVHKIDTLVKQIETLVLHPNGRDVLVAGNDRSVWVYNLETRKGAARVTHSGVGVKGVAVSANGRLAASAPRGAPGARVWEFETGRAGPDFRNADGSAVETEFCALAFAPGGTHVLSGAESGEVQLWDASTGRLVRTFVTAGQVQQVAFSPDGTRAVSAHGRDRTVRVWDVATGAELARCVGHSDWVWSAVFTPDGTHVLTAAGGQYADGKFVPGSDRTVRLWRLPESAQPRVEELRTYREGLQGVAWRPRVGFSPDGSRVFASTQGHDPKVLVWGRESGRLIRTQESGGSGFGVARSADGKVLALINRQNRLEVREADTGAWSASSSPPPRRSCGRSC